MLKMRLDNENPPFFFFTVVTNFSISIHSYTANYELIGSVRCSWRLYNRDHHALIYKNRSHDWKKGLCSGVVLSWGSFRRGAATGLVSSFPISKSSLYSILYFIAVATLATEIGSFGLNSGGDSDVLISKVTQ